MRHRGRERPAAGRPDQLVGDATGGRVWVDTEKLGSLATIDATPPEELTPAQGGVLIAEGVRNEHKVAWLIGTAIDGYLDIQGDSRQPTLARRVAAGTSHVDDSTLALLDHAFGGREQLTLGAYDARFAEAWNALGDRLSRWQRTGGLWDPAGDRRRKRAQVLGSILAPLGLVLTFLSGIVAGWWDWPRQVIVMTGAVVAGTGLAAGIHAWELRTRTPTGSGLWLRVESFRRLLAESRAQQADEATKRGQLGLYTVWAVALGEIDCWSRAVTMSTLASSSKVPMYDPATVRDLSSATLASGPPASNTLVFGTGLPSSGAGSHDGGSHGGWSGGGGGGGSSGGGGGGGGGGGSW